jgi:hypothetical protein
VTGLGLHRLVPLDQVACLSRSGGSHYDTGIRPKQVASQPPSGSSKCRLVCGSGSHNSRGLFTACALLLRAGVASVAAAGADRTARGISRARSGGLMPLFFGRLGGAFRCRCVNQTRPRLPCMGLLLCHPSLLMKNYCDQHSISEQDRFTVTAKLDGGKYNSRIGDRAVNVVEVVWFRAGAWGRGGSQRS